MRLKIQWDRGFEERKKLSLKEESFYINKTINKGALKDYLKRGNTNHYYPKS